MTDTPVEALEPCPFCGAAPYMGGARIECRNKDCWGPALWHFANPEDAIEAWNRRALSTHPQASGVVKPLEWEDRGPSVQVARSSIGEYRITHHVGFEYHAHFGEKAVGDGPWRTSDPAKAAAQADYERRVLSTPPIEATLLDHFKAMQAMAVAYLTPETYFDLKGKNYREPDNNHTANIRQELRDERARAFANDMIYMLDGPEQRASTLVSTPPVSAGELVEPVAWRWRQRAHGKWLPWNICWDSQRNGDTSDYWRELATKLDEVECEPLVPASALTAANADRDALQDVLRLILPMAKGYADAHPVGRNAEFIQQAEAVLSRGEGTADDNEGSSVSGGEAGLSSFAASPPSSEEPEFE